MIADGWTGFWQIMIALIFCVAMGVTLYRHIKEKNVSFWMVGAILLMIHAAITVDKPPPAISLGEFAIGLMIFLWFVMKDWLKTTVKDIHETASDLIEDLTEKETHK